MSFLTDTSYFEIRWEAIVLKSGEQVPVMKFFCAILQNLTGYGKQEVKSKLLDVHHKNTENPHPFFTGSISKSKTHSGSD